MFSPHYARAHARAPTHPHAHLALNVALYGRRHRWAFVEQPADFAAVTPSCLRVGRSRMRQHPSGWTLDVAAPRAPWQRPLRGRITLTAAGPAVPRPLRLDAAGRHRWWPRLPHARVEVDFAGHGVRWRGRAYHDLNWGDEPLARGFAAWQWMRAVDGHGTQVDYRVERRDGSRRTLSLALGHDGRMVRRAAAPTAPLGRTGWGLGRWAPRGWRLGRTLEDTPFYARSLLRATGDGANKHAVAVHESLTMRRWQAAWVRFLLPFRLRRLGRPALGAAPPSPLPAGAAPARREGA